MIKIYGYAPDLNPTIEGVLTDVGCYIPSTNGIVAAPSAVTGTLSAALETGECLGSALLRSLDNSTRMFAGTATKLYEGSSTAWTDRTRAVGGDYTGAADNRWRFTQFGNVSIATNKADTMQFSLSGAFANISGGIKAAIVETVNDYIIACDTNEATFTNSPNRWWVTPDYANWTPSIANRIASGILTSSPGPIVGARRFGDNVILYKQRSMYFGTFTGPPTIFAATQVPGEIGAASHEAVVNVGTDSEPKHIFMGMDDFYLFDGARPIPIGGDIKRKVFSEFAPSYFYRVTSLHDRTNTRIYFYYPSGSNAGAIDKCVVYNYRTNRWGRDDRTIEATVDYANYGITYDDFGSLFATYDTNVPYSYDSPFWLSSGTLIPALFNSSHVLQTLSGTPGDCYFTTGDIGDEIVDSVFTRAQPRFLRKPNTATCTNFYKAEIGDSDITDATVSIVNGRFDFRRDARWHKLRFVTNGNSEVSDLRVDIKPGGQR